MMGDRETAELYFNKSIKNFYKAKDTVNAATTIWNLAVHYQDIGEYGESLKLMNELMVIYSSLGDQTAVGEVYNGLAVTYDYLGSPLKALQNYDSAYAILSNLKDTVKMANVLTNLATIHSSLGDKKTAKKILHSVKRTSLCCWNRNKRIHLKQ
jgi:tetratricopeptide (TPR) repeat protein